MKGSRSNRIAAALAFVVAALALGEPTWAQSPGKGGGAIPASPARLTKIRLVLGATPDTELSFAPFSVASHLGYWRQEGLDVEVAGLAGMSSSVQALLLGKADIAAVAPDTVLAAADQGRPLAVTPFYTWIRKSKVAVIVPANSPITSLDQLKGKVIGVTTLADSNTTVTKSMLAGAEGVPASELDILPVGLGAPAGEALPSGRIAAYSGADSRAAQLVGLGYKVRYLPIPAKYQDISDATFAAAPDTLKNHPDWIKGFGRGFSAAVAFCKQNVDACIKINWKVYPAAEPSNAETDFKAASTPARTVLEVRLPKYYADDGKWGETHADYWLNLREEFRTWASSTVRWRS